MPAQARTVVMPATISAMRKAFKDLGLAVRGDCACGAFYEMRFLWSLTSGVAGYLTLSHISSELRQPFTDRYHGTLFVAQGFDGIEGRGLPRGVDAEDQSNNA